MEHVRMRFGHELMTSDMVDMELIELKFIFDRCEYYYLSLSVSLTKECCVDHHDNRDFEIIPNYSPRNKPSSDEQTLLFGKSEGVHKVTLILYIKR